MSGRINALEGLRGWAALLVVLYHLPKWHHFQDVPLINNGHLMVPLFFVLSGFVIHGAYAGRIDSTQALLRFQYLRFWRLYPVHLLFLVAYFLLECARWFAVSRLATEGIRVEPFSQNSWTAFGQQLLLVQAIGPTGQAQTFNIPAWSISVEFYTYMIFGLFALCVRRHLTITMAVLLAVSSMLMMRDDGFESLLTCFVGFSLGCLISAMSTRQWVKLPGWAASATIAAFFGYLALTPTPPLGIVFILASLLVLAVSQGTGGWAVRLLANRLSLWLGAISYSLYMCHALILWLMSVVLRRGFGLREILKSDGRWVLDLSLSQALISCILTVGAALFVGWLVMRYVEFPARDWSRKKAGLRKLDQPAPILEVHAHR